MSAQTLKFPKPMKRGPKVRSGPCASIIAFPAPLAGDDLHELWYWLFKNHDDWHNEELTGSIEDWRKWVVILTHTTLAGPLTDERMRKEVPVWQEQIRKRTRIKDWLESQGIDWDVARNPNQALEFVFDRLSMRELPASA